MREFIVDITGYEGIYKVSDKGRVFDNKGNELPLNEAYSKRYKYPYVNLIKDGVTNIVRVDKLVADEFCEHMEGTKLFHVDGNNFNCVVENLIYKKPSNKILNVCEDNINESLECIKYIMSIPVKKPDMTIEELNTINIHDLMVDNINDDTWIAYFLINAIDLIESTEKDNATYSFKNGTMVSSYRGDKKSIKERIVTTLRLGDKGIDRTLKKLIDQIIIYRLNKTK